MELLTIHGLLWKNGKETPYVEEIQGRVQDYLLHIWTSLWNSKGAEIQRIELRGSTESTTEPST